MIPFTKTYTIRRIKPARLLQGIKVSSAEIETFAIKASVQPVSMNEINTFPEGKRFSEQIHIYTDFNLQATGENGKAQGDLISFRGREYEVFTVLEWDGPITHREAIASLVKEGTH